MLEHREWTMLLAVVSNESSKTLAQAMNEKDELYRAQLHERRKRLLIIEAKINRLLDKALERE